MNKPEKLHYEQKTDRISEHIEEIVLDAVLAALQKIKKRNQILPAGATNAKDDIGQF
jgi:hypothetical protein